jgi:hypothetical protein
MEMKINLGKWNKEQLDGILHESSGIDDVGERINVFSKLFFKVGYEEKTLIGNEHTPEIFVINLAEVDCFTFLDYIEAMRLSGSFSEFTENLKRVRYRASHITFESRNHFFTDWRDFNTALVDDVTENIGGGATKKILKKLNEKGDGTHLLPGIRSVMREIGYIPSGAIDDTVMHSLLTGDYAGIYSDEPGLDVSHVGIIVKEGENVFFRHASSIKEYRKVVDQDFRGYMEGKPGLIVLRPRARKNNVQ